MLKCAFTINKPAQIDSYNFVINNSLFITILKLNGINQNSEEEN